MMSRSVTRPPAARVRASINKTLVPYLNRLGFTLAPRDDPRRGWYDGRYFSRMREGREHVIAIGRWAFGTQLEILVARGRVDGDYQYLDWRQLGIESNALVCAAVDDVERVVLFVRDAIEAKVVTWLDSPE